MIKKLDATTGTPSPVPTLPPPNLTAFLHQHAFSLTVESLTEAQLAESLRQALEAGGFVRYEVIDGRHRMVYLPWQAFEELLTNYNKLGGAVEGCEAGKSNYETTMRFI